MPDLSRLFDHAARTGEPILRPLAYHFPGYEAVHDQFLLGEEILCARSWSPAPPSVMWLFRPVAGTQRRISHRGPS